MYGPEDFCIISQWLGRRPPSWVELIGGGSHDEKAAKVILAHASSIEGGVDKASLTKGPGGGLVVSDHRPRSCCLPGYDGIHA